MLAVSLALAACLSWGGAHFLAGVTSRSQRLLVVLAISQPIGTSALVVVLVARGAGVPGTRAVVFALAAGVVGLSGVAALYRGLSTSAMGVVAPLVAVAPIVPMVAGLVQGERLRWEQAVGIGMALVGVGLVSRSGGAAQMSGGVRSGLAWGAIAALGSGFALFFLHEGASSDPYWATFFMRAISLLPIAVLLAARPPRQLPARRTIGVLAAVGLLDTTATVLFATASTKGMLAVVSVLASLYPVVIVVLARATLGEQLGRVRRVGALVAFAGAALMSVP